MTQLGELAVLPEQIADFSQQAAVQLGHYVYALIDPTKQLDWRKGIFFIGKGMGQRCFAHSALAEKNPDFPRQHAEQTDLKISIIREILQSGRKPEIKIVAHALDAEADALRIEAILIEAFCLANKQSGHRSHHYWRSTNEIEELHGQKVSLNDPRLFSSGATLLVSLNKSYEKAQGDQNSLKRVTLGDWDVGETRAKQVRLIVGVFRSTMVSFYRTRVGDHGDAVIKEAPNSGAKGAQKRFRWEGEAADDLREVFFQRSLWSDDLSTLLSKMPRGGGYRFLADDRPERP